MSDNGAGCVGWVGAAAVIIALGSLAQCFNGGGDHKASGGPVPDRFQGAYNSLGCGSTDYIAGLVTVGDADINYGAAQFRVESVVSQTDNAVKVRGRPLSANGTEAERDFMITYAPVGGMANLDGAAFHRCSQY